MKTATLPAVRVTPEVRELAQSVLQADETLSMFIEDSLRKQIAFRQSEQDFIARGLVSAAQAKENGVYFTAEESLGRFRAMWDAKKKTA